MDRIFLYFISLSALLHHGYHVCFHWNIILSALPCPHHNRQATFKAAVLIHLTYYIVKTFICALRGFYLTISLYTYTDHYMCLNPPLRVNNETKLQECTLAHPFNIPIKHNNKITETYPNYQTISKYKRSCSYIKQVRTDLIFDVFMHCPSLTLKLFSDSF